LSFVRGAFLSKCFAMSRLTRSGSRARTPSPSRVDLDPPVDPSIEEDIDVSDVDPALMIRHLVSIGALPAESAVAGSSVPSAAPPDATTQNLLDGFAEIIQRALAQPAPVVAVQPTPTATVAPAVLPSGSGKPSLKFPDPPVFEGDATKLDPWIMQCEMYLRAYGVDLASTRAVEVASMFLRGKALDWWSGQFHLIASGSLSAFGTWSDFVSALTVAFRPVELHKRYLEQLLSISQGKQDMRTYIATFNALRAKVPSAFAEDTLCHLFLQGCRADLQKPISLQYPKTLGDLFKHAVTISDIPGHSKQPQHPPKGSGDSKTSGAAKPAAHVCAHCGKVGHSVDRCFQLHPELKKDRRKSKAT
jgi:hypothetical protein